MTLAQTLSAYAALNAAVAIGFVGLLIVEVAGRSLPARQWLALNYGVCAALVLCVIVSALLPEAAFYEPAVRVWSASATNHAASDLTASWITVGAAGTTFDAGSVGRVWIATALALLALGLTLLLRDLVRLSAIRRRSHCVRRIGRVRVWICDVVATPFSYWRPGRAHVVLPSYLVEQPNYFRIVLAHELQHHRQRDTIWLHAFRALRLLCFANPFAHSWALRVARLQEFACDEVLTARPAFAAPDYARCLLDVALRGEQEFNAPGGAAGLIGFGDPKILIRRIEKMMQPKTERRVRNQRVVIACLATTMTAAAFAAGGWIDEQIAPAAFVRIASDTAAAPANAEASVWPVSGGQVTAEFGKHRGIDIAAAEGTAVLAFRARHRRNRR